MIARKFKIPSTGDKIHLVGLVGVDYSSRQDEAAKVTIEVDRFGHINVVDVRYITSTPPALG